MKWKAGPRARAAALLAGPPGLAALLAARAIPPAAAYAAFAALALAWCRVVAGRPHAPAGGGTWQDPARAGGPALAAGAAALTLGALCIPGGWRLGMAVTLFGAAVEEVVFRRELPEALARALGAPARSWIAVGTLAAQVVFAACHFLGAAHPRPFGPGLPFVRLVTSGACLAVLYRASGTLLLPTAVHFWINASLGAGPG